jgi:hypothetical protein
MQYRKNEEQLFAVRVRQISSRRARLISIYQAIWSNMIKEWSAPGDDNYAWLMYSANYLFRTGKVRWAIDPMTLRNRVIEAPCIDIENELQGISVVLLTHEHADHLDLGLLKRLQECSLQWVIPREMLNIVLNGVSLSSDRIIVPVPYETIEVCGLRITPFPGLHWDISPSQNNPSKSIRGVPSTGFLVEMAGKRWLFPGDTRMYDEKVIDEFGPVDVVFAHLWLGRRCALMINPPLIEAFCKFFISTRPEKIVITHLEELGRPVEDYWTRWHARLVLNYLKKSAPRIEVVAPFLGKAIRM